MKDSFRSWSFAECFEFLESPKFPAQGFLIVNFNLDRSHFRSSELIGDNYRSISGFQL